jgi:serine/threonine-protein kinase
MTHSDESRWRGVQDVVDAALDLPVEARAAYIEEACGHDADLRGHVIRLLNACEHARRVEGVLDSPAMAFAAPLFADSRRAALSGRYTVERELGRGGMATVYLARDVRHDRRVAIKVLERGIAHAGAERFLLEIRTAARLTHPHVLGVHDSGEADGLLYYVMPYVEGETLRARLTREGALPLADVTRLVRELADALAYAHGHGVMHRDLKPENVLISGGHAVVADFGIAKAIAAATNDGGAPDKGLTSAGVALGTPAYMAPEQAVGDAAIDHRADLYALGVIAYEALAGAHPFGARSAQQFVVAHLTEAPSPLDARRTDAPPTLVALVMQLIAKDPAARPQSAEAVLRTLDALPTAPTASTATSARTPRWRLAAATVLLLAAGVGAYAAWRGTRVSGPRGFVSSANGIRTLAVLPFVNTGGTAADDYFSDGMTDELAHALGRLPGLRLAGRTSTYQFKGKSVGAQEMGRVLDVGALVAGTVRRAGDRLRVTTQLVSTADGKVLWDSVYESRSNDVFAVQDQFTKAIVAAVTPTLSGQLSGSLLADARRGTTDQEAYELYLRGRYFYFNRNAVNLGRAIEFYRAAVAKDPAFARAHAGLALTYSLFRIYLPDPSDSSTRLTTASAERAIALDSTLADAQIALGASLERRLRLDDALEHFQKALVIEPSSEPAHRSLAFQLLELGRTDEALSELRQASALDPLAKSSATGIVLALITARRFPEALVAAHRAFNLDSTFILGIRMLGLAQLFAGQLDSAARTFERGVQLHPSAPGMRSTLLFAYATAGRWADAERIRSQLRGSGGDHSGGIESEFAELVFGNREPLVRRLVTTSGQLDWSDYYGFNGCNPMFDPLWADARFRAAMRARTANTCPLVRPWPIPPRRSS